MTFFKTKYRIRETRADTFGRSFWPEFRPWWSLTWFKCSWREYTIEDAKNIIERHRNGWVVWTDNHNKDAIK
jgi:hypothetical protein